MYPAQQDFLSASCIWSRQCHDWPGEAWIFHQGGADFIATNRLVTATSRTFTVTRGCGQPVPSHIVRHNSRWLYSIRPVWRIRDRSAGTSAGGRLVGVEFPELASNPGLRRGDIVHAMNRVPIYDAGVLMRAFISVRSAHIEHCR